MRVRSGLCQAFELHQEILCTEWTYGSWFLVVWAQWSAMPSRNWQLILLWLLCILSKYTTHSPLNVTETLNLKLQVRSVRLVVGSTPLMPTQRIKWGEIMKYEKNKKKVMSAPGPGITHTLTPSIIVNVISRTKHALTPGFFSTEASR